MADRTIRVTLVGDATSLINAANESRTALNGLARVNIGNVRSGIRDAGGAADEAKDSMKGWADALKLGLSVVGIQSGFDAIKSGFQKGIADGLEYQGNMNTLKAVTDATAQQMVEASQVAIKLGADLTLPGHSAATATQAMVELAKGGLSMKESQDAARGTLMLATAGHLSAANAAEIQAKALNSFRLEADDAMKVTDLLANAANAASGEVTDMAMALQQSATVANGMGASIEETTTLLGLMAKNGVIGSDAGTSLKTMFTQLASPTREQVYALKDLNVSMFDAKGNFAGAEQLTRQLSVAYNRLSTEQYNTAAATAFGTDALRTANILGAEGVDGYNAMAQSVGLAGGAAELAEAQNHGLNGSLMRLESVAQSTSTELFKRLQPSMEAVVNAASWMIDKIAGLGDIFGRLPGPVQGFALGLAAVVLLRGPLAFMLTTLKLNIGTLIILMKQGEFGALTFRNAMVVAGIGVKAFGTAIKTMLLTNPLGWLILIGSTLAGFFMTSTDSATDAVLDFSDVVDKNTGKLKENAAENLNTQEKYKGMRDRYLEMGGALGELTDAMLGDPTADAKVRENLQKQAEQVATLTGEYQQWQNMNPGNTKSLHDFAEGILGGTIEMEGMSDELRTVYSLNADFIAGQNGVSAAIDNGKKANDEYAASKVKTNELDREMVAKTKDVEAAIKKAQDSFKNVTDTALVYNDRMKPVIAVTDEVARTYEYLKTTMATGGMASVPRWIAVQMREHDAAFRQVGASARAYEASVDAVAAAESNLTDVQNGSESEMKAIASAQKGVSSAQEQVTSAEAAYAKTVKTNAKSIGDAEKSLTKAREQAVKAAADAQKDLQKAREDSVKNQADAEKELGKARKDAAEKVSAAEKDVAKARADAIKSVRKEQADLAKAQAKAAEDMATAQDKLNKAMREGAKGAIDLRVAKEAVVAARAKAADETVGSPGSAETAAFNTFTAAQDKLFALQRSGTASAYELAKAQDAVKKATANPNLAKELADAMDTLTKAEKDNADNTEKTKDAQKDADKTRTGNAEKLKAAAQAVKDAASGGAEKVANAQAALAKASEEGAVSIAEAQAKVKEAVASGAEAVAQAQTKIAETAKSSAESVASAQEQVSSAYESAAESAASASKTIADANQGVIDAQAALAEAQQAAIPTAAELREAERQLADAKDAQAAASDAQKTALEGAADAAALAVSTALALGIANGGLEKGVDDAAKAADLQKEAFIKNAEQLGYTHTEAVNLANQYGLMDGTTVHTTFDSVGADAAKLKVDLINEGLDTVEGRTVHWTAIGDAMVHFDWADVQKKFKDGLRFLDPTGKSQAPDTYGDTRGGPGGLAIGGIVTGPGGPKDDMVSAWLSNGEFVVNAAQTAKHRALLENINEGRKGYATGGMIGMPLHYATGGPIAKPVIAKADHPDAWGAKSAWGAIDPLMKGMDKAAADSGKAQKELLDNAVTPTWDGITQAVKDARESVDGDHEKINAGTIKIGKTLADTQTGVIAPNWAGIRNTVKNTWDTGISQDYARLNAGTTGIGSNLDSTHRTKIAPTWDAITSKVANTWKDGINPQYGNINSGTKGIGTALGTTKTTMDTQWSAIGTSIKNGYDNSIKPAYDNVTAYTKAVSGFFDGIATGTQKASTSTSTDLAAINKEIDTFFAKVGKLAPVAPATNGGTQIVSGASQALADGGVITAGTGPRADDVHIRASKGEYVVNAKSTAKHRKVLDQINYGGAFADGGYITGKAGDVIANGVTNAIVKGTQRAIGAGVDRLVAAYAPTDGGSGEYLPATGARGKFLDAVLSQRGTEYLWGGATPPLFDCSGLMSWGLEQAGVGKGRLTASDFNHSFPHITVAKPGDMVTFDTGRIPGDAGHIGAVLDPSRGLMMHTDGAGPARVSDYKSRDGGPLSIIDPIGGKYVPKTPDPPVNGQPGDPPSAGSWLAEMLKRIKSMVAISDAPFAGLAPDQSQNARAIAGVADKRGLGHNGVLIGEVTAFTESTLHNVAHGDAMGPSSTGLFQQMPSWGSYKTRMDPTGSAGLFYDALLRLDPSWVLRSIPMAAQGVQQSEFSDGRNYANNMAIGQSITRGLGYDRGGKLLPGMTEAYNATGKPEPVLTDYQWELAHSAMSYVINNSVSGASPQVTLNARVFVGGRELMDDVRIEVDNSYVQLRTEIQRQRRQEL